jgi:hypothetical protein
MEKISIIKVLIILFEHLWEVELTCTVDTFLPSSSLKDLSSLILFPLFATFVIDTGGKFTAGMVDTVSNLPPVSTTLAKLVAKFASGVVHTSGEP